MRIVFKFRPRRRDVVGGHEADGKIGKVRSKRFVDVT